MNENDENEKWFIAYSSPMLDCTRRYNIKTLKQEQTQNHNTPVTYNIQ